MSEQATPLSDDNPSLVEVQNARALVVVPMTGSWDYYTSYWATRQGPKVAVKPYLHRRPGFVEDMRQKICNLFLETGIEWLMCVDNDTIPSFSVEKAVLRAESLGAKCVAYPTPFLGSDPRVLSNIFMTSEAPDGAMVLGTIPWHGLPWSQKDSTGGRMMFKIGSAGMGCYLVHRSILADLMRKADAGELTEYPFRACFVRGELKYGEDQMFFLRVQGALETEVWTDLECWCSHRKVVLMNPNLARDFFESGEGAPDPRVNPDAPYFEDTRPTMRAKALPDPDASVLKKIILTDTDPV